MTLTSVRKNKCHPCSPAIFGVLLWQLQHILKLTFNTESGIGCRPTCSFYIVLTIAKTTHRSRCWILIGTLWATFGKSSSVSGRTKIHHYKMCILWFCQKLYPCIVYTSIFVSWKRRDIERERRFFCYEFV